MIGIVVRSVVRLCRDDVCIRYLFTARQETDSSTIHPYPRVFVPDCELAPAVGLPVSGGLAGVLGPGKKCLAKRNTRIRKKRGQSVCFVSSSLNRQLCLPEFLLTSAVTIARTITQVITGIWKRKQSAIIVNVNKD